MCLCEIVSIYVCIFVYLCVCVFVGVCLWVCVCVCWLLIKLLYRGNKLLIIFHKPIRLRSWNDLKVAEIMTGNLTITPPQSTAKLPIKVIELFFVKNTNKIFKNFTSASRKSQSSNLETTFKAVYLKNNNWHAWINVKNMYSVEM